MNGPKDAIIPLERDQYGNLNEATVKALSERAKKTMQAWIEPAPQDPAWVRVAGLCPHCPHRTEWYQYLVVWNTRYFKKPEGSFYKREAIEALLETRARGGEPVSPYEEFGVGCRCGKEHEDGLDGGCGAAWKINLADQP